MCTNSFDIILSPDEMPKKWYNFLPLVQDDLPNSLEHTTSICSSQFDVAKKIRPKALLAQDKLSTEWIDIPEEILGNLIKVGRPTPLRRAVNLERYLGTSAKIYFKREDVLATGSFKLNTAISQLYYTSKEGFDGVVSETGAGQWGMALSLASKFYGLKCKIFMAKCSLEQKPYKQMYSALLGCNFSPSPGPDTIIGQELLASNPTHPGDIGTAISEAINYALNQDNYAYLSGSNTNHVMMHQSLLGLETKLQLDKVGDSPDELIACVSGGSNFSGLVLPYLSRKIDNPDSIRFIAAESTAAPRLTEGHYDYDYSDYAGYTPKTKSYTMGHEFIPNPIHVGGLRQHNGNPVIGYLRHKNLIDAYAYNEVDAFEAAKLFLHTEGVLVAPESAHAVKAAIDSALKCKSSSSSKTIVFLCSGSGFLDLEGYDSTLK